MIVSNVKKCRNGWFVGDFDPAVFKTKNCEVGIHEYKKGFIGKDHFHLLSKEYNFIISGKLIANGIQLNKGDIFIFSESEISSTEFLEDTMLLIFRDSSNKNDKYISYAQFNTDADILNTYFKNKTTGIMIEVGAGWPELHSQSKLFRDIGWRTILFEPDPHFIRLYENYKYEIHQCAISDKTELNKDFKVAYMSEDINIQPWSGFHPDVMVKERRDAYTTSRLELALQKAVNIKVDYYCLNDILPKINVDNFDYMTVDVEGYELEVLMGIDFKRYTPKVLLIENVTNNPKYNSYLSQFGYKLVDFIANQDQLYIKE
jgi:FkbM family methyltransferase